MYHVGGYGLPVAPAGYGQPSGVASIAVAVHAHPLTRLLRDDGWHCDGMKLGSQGPPGPGLKVIGGTLEMGCSVVGRASHHGCRFKMDKLSAIGSKFFRCVCVCVFANALCELLKQPRTECIYLPQKSSKIFHPYNFF